MTHTPKIFLIDDLRSFRDDRECVIARTSAEALNIFDTHPNECWDEIWLDHDLGLLEDSTPDTIMKIVDFLSERAFNDNPVNVGVINVHTSNPVGAKQMMLSLERFGYKVQRVIPEHFFIV